MDVLVILGTGTDVGKSYVSCRLAEALRDHGPVVAVKPVETGVTTQALDAAALAGAAGHHYIEPFATFTPPVSPHLAAELEGEQLSITEMAQWCLSKAEASTRWLIVESAGGAFSPLSLTQSNAELPGALRKLHARVSTLLVARDRLGVLHDVLATLRALSAVQAPPTAIVLSCAGEGEAAALGNARELARLQAIPVYALAYGATQPPAPLIEALVAAAAPRRDA